MRRNVNIASDLDWVSIMLYLMLVFIGWLNIYAAVYSEEHSSIFDISQRYGKQILWISAAIAMCLMALFIDVKFYLIFANIIFVFSIIMLIAVAFFGKEVNGARAWFQIGSFSLQPTEFSKIGVALAVAKYISSYNVKLNNIKQILIAGLITFTPAVFIALQPDFGSIIVFFAFFIVFYREGFPGEFLIFGFLLIFLLVLALLVDKLTILIVVTLLALFSIGLLNRKLKDPLTALVLIAILVSIFQLINKYFGTNISSLLVYSISIGISLVYMVTKALIERTPNIPKIVMFLFIAVGFTFSVNFFFNELLEKHQQERIEILLGKKSDLRGAEYNVNQSKIAIGSGGFFGKGFLLGTQTKYNFVPEQSTDFIFCTIGEEWGFVGSFIVLGLFGALILRIIFLAERQKSTFSRVYGYSVASIFFIHVVVNIGMTIGILPVIGIPLPFMSYGGSSLWGFTILLFIFLRLDVSRYELLR